jgi:hypothetical protein
MQICSLVKFVSLHSEIMYLVWTLRIILEVRLKLQPNARELQKRVVVVYTEHLLEMGIVFSIILINRKPKR